MFDLLKSLRALIVPFVPCNLISFVHKKLRHYEEAARSIAATARLPSLKDFADLRSLAAEVLAEKQRAILPAASIPALTPDEGPRWDSLRRAHAAIDPMFWGSRVSLEDAFATKQGWVNLA